jgi:thymidylate synthase (FAD)
MKVELLNYTQEAAELLIFTKSTRLTLSPGLLDEIRAMSDEKKAQELAYIANTIPSSWEFCDFTFLITGVSRGFTHQFVRTRTGSYAQQTQRVLEMGEFDYIYTEKNRESMSALNVIDQCLRTIKDSYNALRDLGQPAEDARGLLPTNIATNIVAKFNLRTLSDLVKSRTGGRTQNEYQQVANAMADAVIAVYPWTEQFLFRENRDYFNEIEEFAKRKFPDLKERGELLKIVDAMRKG